MLSAAGVLTLHRAIRRTQRGVAVADSVAEWDAAWQRLYDVVDSLADDLGGHDRSPAPPPSAAVQMVTGQRARRPAAGTRSR